MKKWWIIILIVVILVIVGIMVFDKSEQAYQGVEDGEFIPGIESQGLGDLCESENDCADFCDSNIGQCESYCDSNPNNPICEAGLISLIGDELGGTLFKPEDCEGGRINFDYAPVNLEKTELFVPLGLMTGGHVTPIDHHYFQNFANDKVDIEVYSPGDGTIVDISHMFGERQEGGDIIEWADFRVVIEHTCTISSIYIHIDELSEKLASEAPEKGGYSQVSIPVSAGEIIGRYSNNVDYNLVDLDVTLEGLLIPEHYEGEPWKIHVPETIEYFNEPIKSKLIELSIRTQDPISGKLDHDIDGKLQGNWFIEGSNGYAGGAELNNYWTRHLSISPNYLDPNHIIVSMGDYDGREEQFGVKGNSPKPSEVGVDTGLVKYELVSYDFITSEGESWDRISLAKIVEVQNYDAVNGVVLIEMIEDRKLRFEAFPGKTGSEVSGFSGDEKVYER